MSLRLAGRCFASNAGLRFLQRLTNYERKGLPDQSGTDAFPLERMRELLKRLGDPQQDLKVLHVAGSKGKGSVAAYLAVLFAASQVKVGRCISPHVASVTERVATSNGTDAALQLISLEELDSLVLEHKSVIEEMRAQNKEPTYFEVVTALSFMHFTEKGVRHAVVETGLGGMTDATNVFEEAHVDATVLCPIEEEHVGVLGKDLESIVEMEASIVKEGRPVVLAEQSNSVVRDQILGICDAKACRVAYETDLIDVEHQAYQETDTSIAELVRLQIDGKLMGDELRFDRLRSNMIGKHQHDNMKTSILAACVAKKQGWSVTAPGIKQGIEAAACLAGRCQVLRTDPGSEWFVLDGAHTKQACKALTDTVRQVFPDEALVLILTMSKDKQHEESLAELIKVQPDVVIFTSLQSTDRSLPPGKPSLPDFSGHFCAGTLLAHWENCEAAFKRRRPFRCRKTLTANISTAIIRARTELQGVTKQSSKSPGVVCIAGSLYAAGEALNYFNTEAATD